MITTVNGLMPVEDLREGHLVLTRDNGYQPVRWVGERIVDRAELSKSPHFNPVQIAADALAPGVPERDLIVSPQHRMVVENVAAQLLLGHEEVFVKAKDLLHKPGVTRVAPDSVTYLHVMFDNHEVILAENAWTESFQPADVTNNAADEQLMSELCALFPELSQPEGRQTYSSARRSARWFEARLVA